MSSRYLFRDVEPLADSEIGAAHVEGRQYRDAISDYGHALCLEIFDREAEIEDRLEPGADHCHGCEVQFRQAAADVESSVRVPVETADSPGCEDPDACMCSNPHGRGDGGAAGRAGYQACGKVRQSHFAGPCLRIGNADQMIGLQAHFQLPVHDCDCRGDGSLCPRLVLCAFRGLEVDGMGQPMSDDGRFQGHERRAVAARPPDFGTEIRLDSYEFHGFSL